MNKYTNTATTTSAPRGGKNEALESSVRVSILKDGSLPISPQTGLHFSSDKGASFWSRIRGVAPTLFSGISGEASGIFERMARLFDQRKVVLALYNNFSRPENSDNKSVGALAIEFGGFDDLEAKIFLGKQDISNALEIYQSCKDDGYIRKLTILSSVGARDGRLTEEAEIGMVVSSRGSDLLHWLGFLEAFLSRYSKARLVLVSFVAAIPVNTIIVLTLKYFNLI